MAPMAGTAGVSRGASSAGTSSARLAGGVADNGLDRVGVDATDRMWSAALPDLRGGRYRG